VDVMIVIVCLGLLPEGRMVDVMGVMVCCG